VKARKLSPATILSRSRPEEWTPREESGALSRRVAGWAFFGGLGWFAAADLLARVLNLSLTSILAIESIYVVGVSAVIYLLARPGEYPGSAFERRRPVIPSTELVQRLARVAALHDGETASHCERIGALAYELAIELGLHREVCERLRRGAVLHDLGKIGIDRSILLKPGPLDDWERSEVQKHVELGAALLEGADDPILGCALVAIRAHHERWDGRGYPVGLSGEEIPLVGRIVAVCDVFDALASDRPYHPAMSPQAALAIIRQNAGAQFDPDIVAAFERCFPRLTDLYESPLTA
jgi:HD-GYP domain-containing protein (c-di-GMP phosphodiesterase class II)